MDELMDRTCRVYRFVLERGVGYFGATIMLTTTLLTISEVIRRYVFGVVFHWGQDAVTFLMAGAIFLFFAVTQARRSHLAVTALLDWMSASGHERLVLLFRAAASAISVGFSAAFMYWGLQIAERSFEMGRLTQSMVLPLWPFQYALILGFALMSVSSLFHLYQDIRALRGKPVFTWAESEQNLEV